VTTCCSWTSRSTAPSTTRRRWSCSRTARAGSTGNLAY
jgi:hypothetical protein